MDSNNKISLEKVLSAQWLISNGIVLKVVCNDAKRYPIFFICRVLHKQYAHQKKTVSADSVLKLLQAISKRTIINYIDKSFVFKNVFDKAYRDYDKNKQEIESKEFTLQGLNDGGSIAYEFPLTIQELKKMKFIIQIIFSFYQII